MKIWNFIALFAFVFCILTEVLGQTELLIDIDLPITDYSRSINDNENYFLRIIGLKTDPSYTYTISIEIDDVLSPPIAVGGSALLKNITEHSVTFGALRKSQVVTVIIIEAKSDGSKKTWNYKYKTPLKGKWITTFGYSTIVDIGGKSSYYLEQKDITFVIQRDRSPDYLYYQPSVMFSWIGNSTSPYSISWTAGLGLDFSNPTLLFGFGIRYHENIGIDVGFALHKVKFLRGNFSEGQILKESISDEALHKDKYRVNPFISLSLRLDKNPFTKTVEN